MPGCGVPRGDEARSRETGDDVAGIGVHIAARVLGAAAPSRVWVTGTVRELVIGSGIEFESRGERPLKGVPGTWHLHEVRSVG